jgi:hypothetical protein
MSEIEVSPGVVWALGVLAFASVLEVVALAIVGARLLRAWSRLQAVGERIAADVQVAQRDLAVATKAFCAASSAGRQAVARARAVARFAGNAAWMVGGVRRLGFARAAASWGLASLLRQRG